MTDVKQEIGIHPTESELADYLSTKKDKERVEAHIAGCTECLDRVVSAYESVKTFNKGKVNVMKKMNVYLILAVMSFALSFIAPRYFLQFLTATMLLGIKWIIDSKSTKMLVMIYESWKRGNAEETSRIISSLGKHSKNRL